MRIDLSGLDLRVRLCALCLALLPAAACAVDRPAAGTQQPQTAPLAAPAPRGDLDFVPLPDLLPVGQVQLVNGEEVVDPSIWSTVVVSRSIDGSLCTATLVGPRTLLTAAHCVDAYGPPATGDIDGLGTRKGRVKFSGNPVPIVSCTMHPDYARVPVTSPKRPRSSADYALCELARNVDGMVYETMDLARAISVSSPILMTGYGCTDIGVENGELVGREGEGTLRLGLATVGATGARSEDGVGASYLRIRAQGKEPVLCPGDSGGPALVGATVAQKNPQGRRVVAVNSMVEAMPSGAGYAYFSYLAPLGTDAFRRFQQGWTARSSNRTVCDAATVPLPADCRK
jgi:hypothetical protein